MPENVDMLNVNFPKYIDRSTRIVATRLARISLNTKVYIRYDPRGREYYWLWGEKFRSFVAGTDGYEVLINNNISITPISLSNLSEYRAVSQVNEMVEYLNDNMREILG